MNRNICNFMYFSHTFYLKQINKQIYFLLIKIQIVYFYNKKNPNSLLSPKMYTLIFTEQYILEVFEKLIIGISNFIEGPQRASLP